MTSRDTKFNIEKRLSLNVTAHFYAAYFVSSVLSIRAAQLKTTVVIRKHKSSLNSNYDLSEYVMLLLGYGDQYRIKIYKFKWDRIIPE